ncbi:hypothetical protein DSM112329_03692 [Paraconexibacter sp. AEG42_29]|uniref:Leucine-binding protein domain-containing protein n=1 Tax=Paraconexibacter sp. AEG42_29 TaxID=2997339 RepID=A0AAU7AYV2_9ACTN
MSSSKSLSTAAVLVATLSLAACGTGDATTADSGGGSAPASGGIKGGPGIDVAAKTIRIGDISALSGPVAVLGEPLSAGRRAYFKQLNASGGIDGWKIKLTTKDSGYQPQQHVQQYTAVSKEIAILNSLGSPTTKAIQAQIDRDKLVTFPASFDSIWGADPQMAPIGTPYSYDLANLLDYYVASVSKKPKIGLIYANDEYGADGRRGYDAAQESLGFEDVGQLSYKTGDTDFTGQVQKLKSAGAEGVVLVTTPSATGPIVGTAASLGFTPQWLLQGPAFLEQLITKDGSSGAKATPVAAALKGALVTSFAAPWGAKDVDGMADMIAAHDKYTPDQPPSIYYTVAYAQGKVQAELLRKAIAAGDLSRAGLLTAKENLGEVDLDGLTSNPTFTPEGGPPSTKSLITQIDPGVEGFLKPLEPAHGSKAADGLEIPES